MFDESRREDYVEYLLSVKQFEEEIRQLAVCVNDDHFILEAVKLYGYVLHYAS